MEEDDFDERPADEGSSNLVSSYDNFRTQTSAVLGGYDAASDDRRGIKSDE